MDKVGRHGVLLFPGVRRVGGVPAHPHVQTLELSAHLHRGEYTNQYSEGKLCMMGDGISYVCNSSMSELCFTYRIVCSCKTTADPQ